MKSVIPVKQTELAASLYNRLIYVQGKILLDYFIYCIHTERDVRKEASGSDPTL